MPKGLTYRSKSAYTSARFWECKKVRTRVMANHKSAKKRIIRNANRASINGARISRIRTFIKKVEVAIRDLQFSEKRITNDIKKTINSAVANAENNFQYDIDKLIVKEAYCGKKITMKRFRPRAKGRAAPILKPYSSITIILTETKKMESHGSKS